MRWRRGRRSHNVEDRRGQGPVSRMPFRLPGRGGRGARGGGIGIIVLALVAMYFGVDPAIVLQSGAPVSDAGRPSPSQPRPAQEDQLADFIAVVLADTEDTWSELFAKQGKTYQEPVLVLFTGAVRSACGYAQAAMGPFYCPSDQKVYIDLSFYQDLKDQHGAPGDFAQAYVIAHEIGHHVQNLLGISEKVHTARQRAGEEAGNKLSVRLELQADCFAGVWGYHADRTRQILEAGDIDEALGAASSIGDDRLQKQARGYVTPESFTHGSSEQRVRWFKKGISQGSLAACDTFSAGEL